MDQARHSQIVSSTPSRTRIRVSRKRRNSDEMHRIARGIKEKLGAHEVRADVRTGSIVIHHGPELTAHIPSALNDLGVILATATGIDAASVEGKSQIASNLAGAVADLNSRLGFATKGLINLRTLVPLGLGALAVVQLLRRGLQIETTPWYLLAYAAFDSFVKLHYTRESTIPKSERP